MKQKEKLTKEEIKKLRKIKQKHVDNNDIIKKQ